MGRNHNTVRLLLTPAVSTKLLAYARGLLYSASDGSNREGRIANGNDVVNLAGSDVMPLDAEAAASEGTVVPEPYSQERCRRVAHRQWCVMLRIVGTLVWEHPSVAEVRNSSMARVPTLLILPPER